MTGLLYSTKAASQRGAVNYSVQNLTDCTAATHGYLCTMAPWCARARCAMGSERDSIVDQGADRDGGKGEAGKPAGEQCLEEGRDDVVVTGKRQAGRVTQ
jgi:hypothetical protein